MCDTVRIVRERQLAVRREMDRRGIPLKQVQFDSGLSHSTLLSYFPAPGGQRDPAVIPATAIYQLAQGRALPLDLMSLLLPAGVVLVRLPDDADHDAACEAMQDYLSDKARAHHPDSPAGREIARCEEAALSAKLASVRAA